MFAVQEHQSLLPPPPQLLPQDEPDELELESEYDGEDAQLESLLEEADELDEPHDEPPPEDSTSIAGTSNEDASIVGTARNLPTENPQALGGGLVRAG